MKTCRVLIDAAVEQIIEDEIQPSYLTNLRLSARAVVQRVFLRCRERGIDLPSEGTVRMSIPPRRADLGRDHAGIGVDLLDGVNVEIEERRTAQLGIGDVGAVKNTVAVPRCPLRLASGFLASAESGVWDKTVEAQTNTRRTVREARDYGMHSRPAYLRAGAHVHARPAPVHPVRTRYCSPSRMVCQARRRTACRSPKCRSR